jgi:hypothetical protein
MVFLIALALLIDFLDHSLALEGVSLLWCEKKQWRLST